MHICFITHEYPKPGFPHGGLGSFVKTIAEALVVKGIKVSVVGTNYTPNDEESTENGVSIYRVKKGTVKGLSWWFNSKVINSKIKAIHRKLPIDIVEAPELGLAFLHKIKGIKYVLRLHGGHHFFAEGENRGINWWKGFQEKRSFSKADAFVAVSEYVKTHTEKYLSYHNKPIAYISNPINTEVFKPLTIATVPFQIVFAGTICEKKGIRQLIQAFPIVRKKFPEATLEVYGRDWLFPDGSSYLEMLQEKEIPQLGSDSASAITFHGAISGSDIPLKYAKAAVCVFPSHMETLGLVAPEAMAMGKPVIFTNKGPGPEIITDKVTGLLCNPLDPKNIADQVLWVFENEAAASELGEKAAIEASERFSADALINKNIDFFKSLIGKKI